MQERINPWERVSLSDYEAHMNLPEVKQMQELDRIMKSQIDDYPAVSLAIWGVAGGNGLRLRRRTGCKRSMGWISMKHI